jgi:VanZ family protein
MAVQASPLTRYLCAAYALLIIYGSLHPFSGWTDRGVAPFAFLSAHWPRYVTAFDLAANVLAYAPLGLLAALALYPLARGALAVALAASAGLLLSVAMETLQTYLPARIPSNLDVLSNGAGALLGALAGALWAPRLLHESPLLALRHRWFVERRHTDLGLTLLGLWLFTQLDPETLLFGVGDLRDLFQASPSLLYPAEMFIRIEAAVAACNLVAAALFAAALTAPGRPVRSLLVLLLLSALAVRALAFGVLFNPASALAWLTPGALIGIAAGLIAAMIAVALPRAIKLAFAGMALMAATALVNLAPANPYLAQSLQVWPQGNFLNFNGLTHLVSELWPFAALAYLLLMAAGRPENDGSS